MREEKRVYAVYNNTFIKIRKQACFKDEQQICVEPPVIKLVSNCNEATPIEEFNQPTMLWLNTHLSNVALCVQPYTGGPSVIPTDNIKPKEDIEKNFNANIEILSNIIDFLFEHQSQRFTQALYNLGVTTPNPDGGLDFCNYNEKSETTLEKINTTIRKYKDKQNEYKKL